jgi:hypothetical protein
MSVCPWCKSQNPPGTVACLRCGKKAADHPSVAGHQIDSSLDDDFESSSGAPDLQLELGGSQPARGGVQTDSGGGALKSFGDDWGDEEEEAAGPALQLDAPDLVNERASGKSQKMPAQQPGDSPPSGRSGVSVGPARRISGRMQAVSEGAAPEGGAPPSKAPARPGASFEIDPYEVKVLADYGPEPAGLLQTVPYAIKVTLRQRELRRALASVRAALAEAEARRDERLVELGALLRPVVEGSPEFSTFAAPLASAEKTKQARESALQEASSEFRERAQVIDAEIGALDAPLVQARIEADEKAKASERAESLRTKHEARRKRVEIDLRSAQAKVARPETPAEERATAQALIVAAQSERETRAAEERIATQAAQEAEAAAAQARTAVAAVEAKIAAQRARRADLEKEFARQGAVRSQGIEAASREVKTALLEIGKRTAAGGPTAEGADMRRKAVADAEAGVKRIQLDMEKHLRALDAANAGSVRKGLVILGVAIAILLGSFVAWRLLRSNPYLPEGGKTSLSRVGAPCPSA